jgi:hypothetical protein
MRACTIEDGYKMMRASEYEDDCDIELVGAIPLSVYKIHKHEWVCDEHGRRTCECGASQVFIQYANQWV